MKGSKQTLCAVAAQTDADGNIVEPAASVPHQLFEAVIAVPLPLPRLSLKRFVPPLAAVLLAKRLKLIDTGSEASPTKSPPPRADSGPAAVVVARLPDPPKVMVCRPGASGGRSR